MKKIIYITIISILFIASCSTRKNTKVSRTYHNTTTKYNVLYNGNIALEQGIQDLALQYEDDFWQVLPIEPLQIDEEAFMLPGKSKNEGSKTTFDTAEEKAVKAVQKHGMNIGGKEYNKQIDDAYLLLGKSRYYSQRFVPALEAFEYVLKNYPKGDLNKELRIWKAKTQIRLENEEQAITSLNKILTLKKLDSSIKEEVYTALAMAYIALDSTPQAIEQLKKAVKTQENKAQHARNLFVLGQLYQKANNIDSSQIAFKQILNYKKSPYKYKMHSYMEQVKNTTDSTDNTVLKEKLATLIKHYENRSYLGGLYYHAAQLDFIDSNEVAAVEKLKQSIQTPLVKEYQKGKSYEALGNYYFDHAKFVKAGAYYDSVIPTVTNENTKRIRKLKRKIKSLEDVVFFETNLKNNDSIFRLVNMDSTARKEFFTAYTKRLKKADEIAAIQKENATRNQGTGGTAMSSRTNGKIGNNAKTSRGAPSGNSVTKWYFYNTQTVGFGKAEFQKIWGKRKLQDNWRLSESLTSDKEKETQLTTDAPIDNSKKYDVDYYISRIPTEEKQLAVLREQNSTALYQLGLIYKEKFKEYPLAITRLERFLNENPPENKMLPAKYHLYKIYQITDASKMQQLKQEIISQYPDSRYAQIIQNPNTAVFDTKGTPEGHYEKVYCDYEFYEKYQSVLDECELAIIQYKDEPIQPKFELLKSFAIFKLEGKKPFMTNLEYIVGNYPKTEEGIRAQELLDMLNGVKKKDPKKEKERAKKEKAKKEKKKAKSLRGNMSDKEKDNMIKKLKAKGPRSFGKKK